MDMNVYVALGCVMTYSTLLSSQMEEIEYSCEKCNGKAATVTHKFSKLPRYLQMGGDAKKFSHSLSNI